MGDRALTRSLIVEFIGAFTLIFSGAGAVVLTQGQDIVAIALAHGLAIGLMVMAAGHISGGHFNPAVTVAMLLTGRIDGARAIAYIVAQLAGALAAGGALVLTFRDIERNAVNLGVPAIGTNLSAGNALAMEIVLTFFLVFVIFGTAVDARTPKVVSGLVIGLTITMDILIGGTVSGAAMNPARWFGPAIVQQDWSDLWIWWVGPVIGAALAGLLYHNVLLEADVRAGAVHTRPADERGEEQYAEEREPAVGATGGSRRAQRRRRR